MCGVYAGYSVGSCAKYGLEWCDIVYLFSLCVESLFHAMYWVVQNVYVRRRCFTVGSRYTHLASGSYSVQCC